jgi:hypothetical protein
MGETFIHLVVKARKVVCLLWMPCLKSWKHGLWDCLPKRQRMVRDQAQEIKAIVHNKNACFGLQKHTQNEIRRHATSLRRTECVQLVFSPEFICLALGQNWQIIVRFQRDSVTECKVCEGGLVVLFWSLMYPHYIDKCQTYSKCSVNIFPSCCQLESSVPLKSR